MKLYACMPSRDETEYIIEFTISNYFNCVSADAKTQSLILLSEVLYFLYSFILVKALYSYIYLNSYVGEH